MALIEANGEGIALITDDKRRLMATVTDGDIRRAILAGVDLDSPVQALPDNRRTSGRPEPLTAPVCTADSELLRLMTENTLRQIPLLGPTETVEDIALLSELAADRELPISAMVMAGGEGTRLRPLTGTVPKPMVPVDGQPILERIVGQLREAGITNVNLSTLYKKEVIADHFGDGREFGVDIRYVEEDQPLGTAGALSLLDQPDGPLLVMYGDILTKVDFRAMVLFHEEHGADMTVAVKPHEVTIPFGVVETDGATVKSISEKPTIHNMINAGIYLLNPEVRQFVPRGRKFDMPELITSLISEGRAVVSFPIHEYWLDIGAPADYQRTQSDAQELGA